MYSKKVKVLLLACLLGLTVSLSALKPSEVKSLVTEIEALLAQQDINPDGIKRAQEIITTFKESDVTQAEAQKFELELNKKRAIEAVALIKTEVEEKAVQPNPQDSAYIAQLVKSIGKKKNKKQPLTQTEGLLSVKKLRRRARYQGDIAQHKNIIKQAMKKERELRKNYYVFYTAIPYMRLFQDVTRKLYKRAIGRLGALKDREFQFIRYTYDDPAYKQFDTASDFLINEFKTHGFIDDNEVRLKTILVSTNLALFGNSGHLGESTWNYFNNPQPWAAARKDWLQASLKSFGYSTQFLDELLELNTIIKSNKGDLFQIFVPKETINEVGYLSWRLGIPYDRELISAVFGGRYIKYEDLKQVIVDFRRKWKNGDPEKQKIVNDLIEKIRNGNFYLTTALNRYKKFPKKFPINHWQARLLIDARHLLNPESGIRIFRYSTLDPEIEQEYNERLRAIVDRMESDRKVSQQIESQEYQDRVELLHNMTKEELSEQYVKAKMEKDDAYKRIIRQEIQQRLRSQPVAVPAQ